MGRVRAWWTVIMGEEKDRVCGGGLRVQEQVARQWPMEEGREERGEASRATRTARVILSARDTAKRTLFSPALT